MQAIVELAANGLTNSVDVKVLDSANISFLVIPRR
jgi:hypothetical protein